MVCRTKFESRNAIVAQQPCFSASDDLSLLCFFCTAVKLYEIVRFLQWLTVILLPVLPWYGNTAFTVGARAFWKYKNRNSTNVKCDSNCTLLAALKYDHRDFIGCECAVSFRMFRANTKTHPWSPTSHLVSEVVLIFKRWFQDPPMEACLYIGKGLHHGFCELWLPTCVPPSKHVNTIQNIVYFPRKVMCAMIMLFSQKRGSSVHPSIQAG